RVSPVSRIITSIAGTGSAGYAGDQGPATSALLDAPSGIAVTPAGTIFFTDALNHAVRTIDPGGTIATVAGTGTAGSAGDGGSAGRSATGAGAEDGGGGFGGGTGPATAALLLEPGGLSPDGDGGLLVADTGNNRIRRVDAAGTITTIAGSGAADAQSFGDGDL